MFLLDAPRTPHAKQKKRKNKAFLKIENQSEICHILVFMIKI